LARFNLGTPLKGSPVNLCHRPKQYLAVQTAVVICKVKLEQPRKFEYRFVF